MSEPEPTIPPDSIYWYLLCLVSIVAFQAIVNATEPWEAIVSGLFGTAFWIWLNRSGILAHDP